MQIIMSATEKPLQLTALQLPPLLLTNLLAEQQELENRNIQESKADLLPGVVPQEQLGSDETNPNETNKVNKSPKEYNEKIEIDDLREPREHKEFKELSFGKRSYTEKTPDCDEIVRDYWEEEDDTDRTLVVDKKLLNDKMVPGDINCLEYRLFDVDCRKINEGIVRLQKMKSDLKNLKEVLLQNPHVNELLIVEVFIGKHEKYIEYPPYFFNINNITFSII